jgi:hypothetical protein
MKKFGLTAEETKAALIEAATAAGKIKPPDLGGGQGGGRDDGKGSPSSPPKPPRDRGVGQHYINVEREVFGETEQPASESTADIRLFREAIHALHPALAEAGIGISELSALISAARGGFVALAVAIGTLLVTALQKTADVANDAASRLGAFTGSLAAGQRELGGTAREARTTTSSLVAPYEQLLSALGNFV